MRLNGLEGNRKLLLQGVFTVSACVFPLIMEMLGFSYRILFGSYSYEVLDYGPVERIFGAMVAFGWIGFGLLVLLPILRWRLPMLTALGQNTMGVFLLHGFAVRYIQHRQPGMLHSPLMVAVVTALILAICGNPLVGKAFRWLFSGKYMERK